jgi:hypothetical protein
VIEFAELEDFVDMKLKNFSSGMRVRLAFSLLMQSEADALLIDEVLAVGDASFQHKCHKAFQRLREEGRTIIFVTHDMAAAQQYCHRAILLERGRVVYSGTPSATARRYVKLNEEAERPAPPSDLPLGRQAAPLSVREVWVEDSAGERTIAVMSGESLRLRGLVEARRDLDSSVFSFEVRRADGVGVFSVLVEPQTPDRGRLRAGERLTIRADIENPLASGGYLARLWASEGAEDWDPLKSASQATTFEVVGGSDRAGVIHPGYSAEIVRQGEAAEVVR